MPTMRAAVLTGYGGVERFELREVSRPEPGPGQLLVRVLAAGVNPIDWKLRQGRLRLLLPARFPLVLGFDVAGEVAAVGPEVADFAPGDPVFAMLDSRHGGGYAEYAVTGQAAAAPKPEALSWEEAAAVPLAALTALQALRDLGGLQPGERVAVTGAAGGVGHFAVQLAAAALGARVTAVAGPGHQDFVRGLGAHRAVDYTREDFTALDADAGDEADADGAGGADGPAGSSGDTASYEVIFDAAGAYGFAACEPALTAGGVYVTTRPGPAILLAQVRAGLSRLVDRRGARRAAVVHTRPRGGDLSEIADLVAAGRLHPAIDRVYGLEEVGKAHAASQAGHPQGKIVLRVGGADAAA
ncbi:MAG TPA: NADP-dependent oxidoreductase [Thermoanaerobaculia bacterium]|nr:NADP-dependent oxidoreductase [Thermoanaerobaculia bacterium]